MAEVQVFVVAADYGPHEGWLRPIGAYTTEEKALAAIGRGMIEGLWFAQQLRVVPLSLDNPQLTLPATSNT